MRLHSFYLLRDAAVPRGAVPAPFDVLRVFQLVLAVSVSLPDFSGLLFYGFPGASGRPVAGPAADAAYFFEFSAAGADRFFERLPVGALVPAWRLPARAVYHVRPGALFSTRHPAVCWGLDDLLYLLHGVVVLFGRLA